jgi:cytochrome c-type biogenesis protein
VVLVEGSAHLLPREPRPLGEALADALRRDGVELALAVHATAARREGEHYFLELDDGRKLRGDRLLVATGRRPRVDGLGVETVGLKASGRGIPVDARLRAGERLWAIGDVNGIWQLTHVGKYQGRVVAANILGEPREANYEAVPRVVFTDPQAAAVGAAEASFSATAPVSELAKTATYTRAYDKSNGFMNPAQRRRALDRRLCARPGGRRVAAAGYPCDPRPRAARGAARHHPAVPHLLRDLSRRVESAPWPDHGSAPAGRRRAPGGGLTREVRIMIEIALAFAAGLLTAGAPCILPLLPVLLGASIGQQARWRSLFLVAGFIMAFSGFAILFGTFSTVLGLSQDTLRKVSILLLGGFGVLLLRSQPCELLLAKLSGLLSIANSAVRRVASGHVGSGNLGSGNVGGLVLGLTLGVLWTPCAGPVLGSILTLIATSESLTRAGLLLVIYAIGAGIPILLVAYGGQYATTQVRRFARYTPALQRTFGAAVLLVALAFYTQYDTVITVWLSGFYPNRQSGL